MKTKLTLEWAVRDAQTLRGYLAGHPETTLFLIISGNPLADVRLYGAFVPDNEEQKLWGINNAKDAAEQYMRDWLEMVAPQFPPLPEIMGKRITREEVIEGLRSCLSGLIQREREIDPTFLDYPDAKCVLDYIEENGLAPKEAK
jgi:hypothetical protein